MPKEKIDRPVERNIEVNIAAGTFGRDDTAAEDVSGNSRVFKADGASYVLKADGTYFVRKVA